ncbi:DUF4377 domain-containing protein [Echinicola jeungdonensis]|uniref:DUF4377 domain-containing protein n=1 Tax=Echinicola jeungdonensis TaxID=709343 RepID=A0ABV5J0K6_9BACT|nr:DUF4377 domain-containing protein [Echinicola jeungdonensis]MDN3667801.1 DUF4377 domain-containing protein [Echinicola jeungdonensis]
MQKNILPISQRVGKKIFPILLVILTFSSCLEPLVKEEKITVKHYPVVKNNDVNNPTLWIQVQFSHQTEKDEWSEIPIDAIEGFDYELGYEHELRIRKEEVQEPSMERPYIKYTLLSEISKDKVSSSTSFTLPIKSLEYNPSELVSGDIFSGFVLLNKIPIECTTLCDDLEDEMEENNEVSGVFRHNFDGTIKLVSLQN